MAFDTEMNKDWEDAGGQVILNLYKVAYRNYSVGNLPGSREVRAISAQDAVDTVRADFKCVQQEIKVGYCGLITDMQGEWK